MNKSAWRDLAFYFNKPITVQAEFYIKGKRLTMKLQKKIIHQATELAGIAPFDCFMCEQCGHHFCMRFRFDTMKSALAARARLENSNINPWFCTEDEGQMANQFALGSTIH